MSQPLTGTPVTGYVSLTNAAPGPTSFALTQVEGQAPYTLAAGERVYLVSFSVSTNDSAAGLVTIDAGAVQAGPPLISAVTKLASLYPPLNQQLATSYLGEGRVRGVFGVVPRATAGAVTSGKSVEVMFWGYISRQ